jgi:hypothetical protein
VFEPDPFPYKVELSSVLMPVAAAWLWKHVPDTGDEGDEAGWMWARDPVPVRRTHVYSFKRESDAILFALTWS